MTKLSAFAADFVRRERSYLRRRSRVAALQFSAELADVRRLLDTYPSAGVELSDLRGTSRAGLRRWVKGNYTFDYRIGISGEPLVILIRHQAQDDPAQSYEPDDIGDFD